MGSVSRFLFVTISSCLQALFGFVAIFIFRLGKDVDSLEKSSDFSETSEDSGSGSDSASGETEVEVVHMPEEINDFVRSADQESSGGFKFRFPTYEEFINGDMGIGADCEIVHAESLLQSGGSYEFMSENGFSGFVAESEVVNSNVKQLDLDSDMVALNKGLKQSHCVKENEKSDKEKREFAKAESESYCDLDFSDESMFQSEKDSLVTDSDSASIGFEHMHYLMSRLVDSYSEDFLSDEDFGGDFHDGMPEENQESKLMEESLKEFNQENEFLSENDFHEDAGKSENWELDDELKNVSSESKNESDLDYGEANKLESLWEHQHLLEQLKMELKKVRATGLPTIFEDLEYPKMDDLKPWKIDERFQSEDCIGELKMFSKSYIERMRKFDILTYQKVYAVGFLQKDPLQLLASQKSSGPELKSLNLKNIWPFKHKSSEIEPVVKFIKELQCELEVVYVGQMCLSWEFLHWQYGKALDLWDTDPRGTHRYNEVAGEFQQFQVLLQRFLEDEPFHGPRLQYYIKSRYDFRNLLQVPVIREDRKKLRKFEKGDFAITSDVLVEILEECIRIFWRFIKADNDSSIVPVKCQKGVHPEVENADDLELLMEVIRTLQKKERKLKETLRSETCILRRFKRRRDEDGDSDHVLYFFSQVDMKLVSRVLNMSRLTTEQLAWCHNKLSRISFVNRRIRVEPSFLLFPC